MTIVYDLWFTREYEDREDTELHIGIYANREDAAAAIARLADKPGFRDHPAGFEIHPVRLGDTGWTEGFATVRYPRRGPPDGDAADVPAGSDPGSE